MSQMQLCSANSILKDESMTSLFYDQEKFLSATSLCKSTSTVPHAVLCDWQSVSNHYLNTIVSFYVRHCFTLRIHQLLLQARNLLKLVCRNLYWQNKCNHSLRYKYITKISAINMHDHTCFFVSLYKDAIATTVIYSRDYFKGFLCGQIRKRCKLSYTSKIYLN